MSLAKLQAFASHATLLTTSSPASRFFFLCMKEKHRSGLEKAEKQEAVLVSLCLFYSFCIVTRLRIHPDDVAFIDKHGHLNGRTSLKCYFLCGIR